MTNYENLNIKTLFEIAEKKGTTVKKCSNDLNISVSAIRKNIKNQKGFYHKRLHKHLINEINHPICIPKDLLNYFVDNKYKNWEKDKLINLSAYMKENLNIPYNTWKTQSNRGLEEYLEKDKDKIDFIFKAIKLLEERVLYFHEYKNFYILRQVELNLKIKIAEEIYSDKPSAIGSTYTKVKDAYNYYKKFYELYPNLTAFTYYERGQINKYLNFEIKNLNFSAYQKLIDITEFIAKKAFEDFSGYTEELNNLPYEIESEYGKSILDEILNDENDTDKLNEKYEEKKDMTDTNRTTRDYNDFVEMLDIVTKDSPFMKNAFEANLNDGQSLDKILAKEEFITVEVAKRFNTEIFANLYSDEEIEDFENQFYQEQKEESINDKIKNAIKELQVKSNLSTDKILTILQISKEDYDKIQKGIYTISDKASDKLFKAIETVSEFYHKDEVQKTIENTKDTLAVGASIVFAKAKTGFDFLNQKVKEQLAKNKDLENQENDKEDEK